MNFYHDRWTNWRKAVARVAVSLLEKINSLEKQPSAVKPTYKGSEIWSEKSVAVTSSPLPSCRRHDDERTLNQPQSQYQGFGIAMDSLFWYII